MRAMTGVGGGSGGGGSCGAALPFSLGRSVAAFSSPVPKPCTTFLVRPAAAIVAAAPPPISSVGAATGVGATMTRAQVGSTEGLPALPAAMVSVAWGSGRNFVGSESGDDGGGGGGLGLGRRRGGRAVAGSSGGQNFMNLDEVRLPDAMALAPPSILTGSSADGVFFHSSAQVRRLRLHS
jgi:hypothetical protein